MRSAIAIRRLVWQSLMRGRRDPLRSRLILPSAPLNSWPPAPASTATPTARNDDDERHGDHSPGFDWEQP